MNTVSKWLVNGLVVVVLAVWAGTHIATVFDHTYVPPIGLTEMLMAIAGFLLTGKYIHAGTKDADKDKKDGPHH